MIDTCPYHYEPVYECRLCPDAFGFSRFRDRDTDFLTEEQIAHLALGTWAP